MKGRHGLLVRACGLFAMIMMFAAGARGAESAANGRHTEATIALTADDLATFLDEFVGAQLERRRIAGAVVSVVFEGVPLLNRGYGFANVREKIPMTESTLVRVGSLSKLFTAAAVAQLVEQGKLELDRDVNEYLDFKVPTPEGGVPVTLRMLLTHRAGYENHLKNLFAAGTTPQPLGRWLRDSQPVRLFPHGDTPAYSNYGYGLAGYIVERATGIPFERYVEQHIFQPLGMTKATFIQPLPLTPETSLGYPNVNAAPLQYFETITPGPAGALTVNGIDMVRFLSAVLSSSDRNHLRLPAPGKAFSEYELLGSEEDFTAGRRFVGKHGLMLSFVSGTAWLPEHDFGLFVSYNSATAGGAPVELLSAIAARYFARDLPALPADAATRANAREHAGVYEATQRADSTFLRFSAMATRQLIVSAQPDGSIRLSQDTDPFMPAGQDQFRSMSGQEVRFARRPSSNGWTLHWTSMPLPIEWERAPWYLDARILMPTFAIAPSVAVLALLCWPIAALRRGRQQHSFGATPADRLAYVGLRVVLALHVIVFGSFLLVIMQFDDLTRLNASFDPWLIALYAVAWLSIIATPVAIWTAIRFWRHRVGSLWTRSYHSLLAALAAILAWLWFTFRIAGTTLNY